MKQSLVSRRSFVLLPLVCCLQLTACKFGGGQPPTKAGDAMAVAAKCSLPDTAGADLMTTVLFDRTTVLEAPDRDQLVRGLVKYWSRDGGRIAIIVTGGTTSALTRTTFEAALPSAADLRRAGDTKYSITPAEQRAAADCVKSMLRAFEDAVAAALADVDASDKALSPLIEALKAVLGNAGERSGTQRLIYVTDGLQHTQSLTFYVPRTDRVRPMSPKEVVDELARVGALPDAKGVSIVHLAIGLSAPPRQGEPKILRPPAETRLLESIWAAIYEAGGAAGVRFGHPLLPGGFEFADARP